VVGDPECHGSASLDRGGPRQTGTKQSTNVRRFRRTEPDVPGHSMLSDVR